MTEPGLRAAFPVLGHADFLNHASVSPLPARSAAALRLYAGEAERLGGAAWLDWNQRVQRARLEASRLLRVDRDETGFVHNTTHGLMCIANSLPWDAGDNIVTAAGEFPANVYPWTQLSRLGVAVRRVSSRSDMRFNADDFVETIDARTRLVSVSLVQYSTGYRMPIDDLAQICHDRDILLCLDGIQGIGAIPFSPGSSGVDFLVADGHKWMLGPEGAGIIYIRKSRLGMLNNSSVGWICRKGASDYTRTDLPVPTRAARFEDGSCNMGGFAALSKSLALLNEAGIDKVWRDIERLTALLCDQLESGRFRILSPRGDGERSGIVSATLPGHEMESIGAKLRERDIHVTARNDYLRISPHYYNGGDQVGRLVEALHEITK